MGARENTRMQKIQTAVLKGPTLPIDPTEYNYNHLWNNKLAF